MMLLGSIIILAYQLLYLQTCELQYDDFNDWSPSNSIQSQMSPYIKYHGFFVGDSSGSTTSLTKQYVAKSDSQVTLYFTFIWGCTADLRGAAGGHGDYAWLYIDGELKTEMFITNETATSSWPRYRTKTFADSALTDTAYCNHTYTQKVLDGYTTFPVTKDVPFLVNFTVYTSSGIGDEYWSVTNIALIDHGCILNHTKLNISEIWYDDFYYDEINGWSLPNLVLWDHTNLIPHGWFVHEIGSSFKSLNRTFRTPNDFANVTVNFKYLFIRNVEQHEHPKMDILLNGELVNVTIQQIDQNIIETMFIYSNDPKYNTSKVIALCYDISFSKTMQPNQLFSVSINTFFSVQNNVLNKYWGISDFTIISESIKTNVPSINSSINITSTVASNTSTTVNSTFYYTTTQYFRNGSATNSSDSPYTSQSFTVDVAIIGLLIVIICCIFPLLVATLIYWRSKDKQTQLQVAQKSVSIKKKTSYHAKLSVQDNVTVAELTKRKRKCSKIVSTEETLTELPKGYTITVSFSRSPSLPGQPSVEGLGRKPQLKNSVTDSDEKVLEDVFHDVLQADINKIPSVDSEELYNPPIRTANINKMSSLSSEELYNPPTTTTMFNATEGNSVQTNSTSYYENGDV